MMFYIDEKLFEEMQKFINQLILLPEIKSKIVADGGSCIIGEGINVETKFTGERKTRERLIFRQVLTQGSQYDFLMAILEKIRAAYPHYKDQFSYNAGTID